MIIWAFAAHCHTAELPLPSQVSEVVEPSVCEPWVKPQPLDRALILKRALERIQATSVTANEETRKSWSALQAALENRFAARLVGPRKRREQAAFSETSTVPWDEIAKLEDSEVARERRPRRR
jgi:hypothetical protein